MAEEWKAHKAEGNEAYRAQDFPRAIEKYTDALQHEMPDKERATILSNRAQCHLRGKSYEAVVEDCTASLTLDPENVKALFRRCVFGGGLSFAAAVRTLTILPSFAELLDSRHWVEKMMLCEITAIRCAATRRSRTPEKPCAGWTPLHRNCRILAQNGVRERMVPPQSAFLRR